jgi:hypothetical protein
MIVLWAWILERALQFFNKHGPDQPLESYSIRRRLNNTNWRRDSRKSEKLHELGNEENHGFGL